MADYTLTMNIHGDAESFKRALKAAQDAVDGFNGQTSSLQKKLNRVGDSFQGYGKKLTLGVTTPLALAGKKLVDSASDFEENLNKVDVAFGKNKKEVIAWSNTAIKQFGLSKNQALEATSLFGDMATSMGLTKPAAANMSTSLAGLAGDLASFKNISIDQAMTALKSVFTGETESLKELGIVMTQTNLDAFALANGFGKTIDQMTQAEQVQLRYAYVMEATKNAHGDYARTADGTANSMRTFMGSVDNLAIALGQNLLPAVTPLIHKATDLVNRFAELSPQTQTNIIKFGLLAAALGPVSYAFGTVTRGIGAAIGVMGKVKTAGTKIASVVNDINAVKNSFKGMAGPLTPEQVKIQTFALNAKKHFGSVVGSAKTLKTNIVTSFSAVGSTIATKASAMGTSLLAMGSGMKAAIAPFLPAIAIIGAVAAAIVYLFNTNEEFRNSMLQSWAEIKAAFEPVLIALQTMIQNVVAAIVPAITQIVITIGQLIQTLAPLIAQLVGQLTPIITLIVSVVAQLIAQLAPLIAQLIGQIAPVLATIISAIAAVVAGLAPVIATIVEALIPVIQTIIDILTAYVIPIITKIITVVANVIAKVIEIVTPIIEFIAGVIAAIVSTVATIIGKVSSIFGKVKAVIEPIWESIKSFISTVIGKIKSVISAIVTPVRNTFNKVKDIVVGVFNKVQGAWSGFKGFVSGVTDGIRGAFDQVVSFFKSLINNVIKGINFAVGIINKIPGVEIGIIPYLAHGTDNWQGGFAYMNEGGRGELVHLPNGSQVIPHDISVKYAKEAARVNHSVTDGDNMDMAEYLSGAILEGLSGVRIQNITNLDGKVIADGIAPMIDKKLGQKKSNPKEGCRMDALINGVSLANDIGINVTDFAVSGPSPQVVTTSIPGRDGVLDYSKALTGFVMQNNRTLTVSAYVKETYAEYLERHSKILNSIGTDIVKIVNDADSGFYWQGRPSVEYNNIDAVHSEITITCDVHPYKRKLQETVVSRDLTGAEAQIICKNLAEPVVPTFETSASMKIIFGEKSFNIQSGQHILDLVFGPGDNVLKVTGTGNIKIKYREGSL